MRTFLFLLVAAIASSSAVGQQRVFEPDNSGHLPIFLSEPGVIRDLDLSPTKQAELDEVKRGIRSARTDYLKKFIQAETDPNKKEELKQEHIRTLTALADDLCNALGPEKWERLDQLFLRYQLSLNTRPQWFQGEFRAIVNDEVPNLILHQSVQKKLEKELNEQRDELIELFEKHKEDLRKLCIEHEKRALELLDGDERRTFRDMFGEPMNFAIDRIRIPEKKEKPSR